MSFMEVFVFNRENVYSDLTNQTKTKFIFQPNNVFTINSKKRLFGSKFRTYTLVNKCLLENETNLG